MPRVRRKGVSRRTGSEELADYLLYGSVATMVNRPLVRNGSDTACATTISGTEAASAWRTWRGELLAEFGHRPGMRPAGYFRFDLKIDEELQPLQMVHELDTRGLLDRDEAFLIEQSFGILRPRQGAEEFSRAHLSHTGHVLRRIADEYRIAAGWHQRRERQELADKFEYLATAATARIAESTNL